MQKFKTFVLAVSIMLTASIALAERLRVPNPYTSIQNAIDNADSGDTVVVWIEENTTPPRTYP